MLFSFFVMLCFSRFSPLGAAGAPMCTLRRSPTHDTHAAGPGAGAEAAAVLGSSKATPRLPSCEADLPRVESEKRSNKFAMGVWRVGKFGRFGYFQMGVDGTGVRRFVICRCCIVFLLCVNKAVLIPRRAEAAAASQPAWPPPITTTSKYS